MQEAGRNLPPILPPGTQVVLRAEVSCLGGGERRPVGSVAEIVKAPVDPEHRYLIRFLDSTEAAVSRRAMAVRKQVQSEGLADLESGFEVDEFRQHVIYRCVIGSRAYGLDDAESDIDRRGIYLPPADRHWALFGVPAQIENDATQECYWELEKFLTLALKANPNVLECLYTPIVEHATPLARRLLEMRGAFLSKLIYQTYNGYVLSQFKKLEADLRNHGAIKWKHAMHLIRLLLAGIVALREGHVPVAVGEHRERLLSIRRGEEAWERINEWRLALHREFDEALAGTTLPERPDYERVNRFLIDARRGAARMDAGSGGLRGTVAPAVIEPVERNSVLHRVITRQPYPPLFVTISGAHLYGFASADSDFDLRGVHVLPAEDVLGLEARRETIEESCDEEGLEIDLVSHDAAKFFSLMLKRNGYVLEQLFSPLVLLTTPEHEELKALGKRCITRHHVHHYLGFTATQRRLFEKDRRLKPMLYTYRVLLTGIHLMRSGEVEANLERLNEVFRLPYIGELLAAKREGREQDVWNGGDVAFHFAEFDRLEAELKRAGEESLLAEEAECRGELSELLVRLRVG